MYYFRRAIDKGKTLLGDGWLERGDVALIIAASGVGKSILAAQMSSLWALGRECLGIIPSGEMKVLIMQSEDSENKLSLHHKMIGRFANIGPEEEKLLDENTSTATLIGYTPDDFHLALKIELDRFHPDVTIINPLSAFTYDTMDPVEQSRLFRLKIQPLLIEYDCAAICMHHSPKPRDNSDWTERDFAYLGYGTSVLTNFARSIITIREVPKKMNIFKFIASKNGECIGWEERTRFFCHSEANGARLWEPVEVEIDTVSKSKIKIEDTLLQIIKENPGISKPDFLQKAVEQTGYAKGTISDRILPKIRTLIRSQRDGKLIRFYPLK